MGRFQRPELCRLCECPVASGGVRLSEVDRDKLSKWWLLHLDTPLEDENLENVWICQFCKWDARLEHKISAFDGGGRENCDWWKSDVEDSFYKHYLDNAIQPCYVEVRKYPRKYRHNQPTPNFQEKQGREISNNSAKLTANKTKSRGLKTELVNCVYCKENFENKISLVRHVNSFHEDIKTIECSPCSMYFKNDKGKQKHDSKFHSFQCMFCPGKSFLMIHLLRSHTREAHKDEVFWCRYDRLCRKFFKSQEELKDHVERVHEKAGETLRKCVYCNKMVFYLCAHVQKWHKSESLKCNYALNCPNFFVSEEDRQKHILEVHQTGQLREKITCVYCKKDCGDKILLSSHIKSVHSNVMIKCRLTGCFEYFLDQIEHEKHFQLVHSKKEKLNNYFCNLCVFKTNAKHNLMHHVAIIHGAENLQCPKCLKYYKSHLALKKHDKKVHCEIKKCIHCTKPVKYLKQHLKMDVCKFCKKLILCNGLRTNHVQICKQKSEI